MSSKDIKRLEATKADRIKIERGLPTNHEGQNGDLSVRQVPSGLGLYGKFNGKWYKIGKLEDITRDGQAIIGTGDNKEYNSVTINNDLIVKKGSKGIKLNNTSGTLKVRDATDAADAPINASTGTFMTSIELGHASDTTLERASAGEINIQSNRIYRAGGTDVAVADGGTALSTYSGAGRILQSTGATVLAATQTLHDDIQGNITKLGAITEGSWGGTYVTVLPTSKGGVSVTGTDENAVLTLGGSSNNFVAEGGMKFFDSGGYNHLEFTSSSTDDAVIITSAVTAHNVAGDDVTLRAGNTTPGDTDNIAGGHLYIQGGKGKGTGVGGSIQFTVYPAGSTGSTLNSPVNSMNIDGQYGTVSLSRAAGFGITTVTQGHIVGDASPDTGNNTDVDFRLGNKAKLNLVNTPTQVLGFVFPNVSGNFSLILTQDSATRLVTAYNAYESDESAALGSATLIWAGGSNPTLTTTSDKSDIISIYWDQGEQKAYATITTNF